MVSGDNYKCYSCDYNWQTRKSIGEPAICPRCKGNTFTNTTKPIREAEQKRERKERRKELKQIKLWDEAMKNPLILILLNLKIPLYIMAFLLLFFGLFPISIILLIFIFVGYLLKTKYDKEIGMDYADYKNRIKYR
jgi:hypothetical protein